MKQQLPFFQRPGEDVPADLDRLLIEADLSDPIRLADDIDISPQADVDGVGALDFTTFIAITIGIQER